jgi:hypothetical protein
MMITSFRTSALYINSNCRNFLNFQDGLNYYEVISSSEALQNVLQMLHIGNIFCGKVTYHDK